MIKLILESIKMKDLIKLLKLLPIVIVICNFSLTYLIYFFLLVLTYYIISRVYIAFSSMRSAKVQLDAMRRVNALMDWETHNDLTKRYEFRIQTILDDKILTKDEKIVQ